MPKETIQIVHLQMVKDREVSYGNESITTPELAVELVKGVVGEMVGGMDRECMVVCAVDNKMKPVCIQVAGVGAVNSCPCSVPEIFKVALLSNAVNILLFHNHPSGSAYPSEDDIACTERIADAGRLLGIRLRDHIILGDNGGYYSFKEDGRCL